MTHLKTYWVFFRDGDNWFQRWFLKKDFGHIFLLTKDKYNWILIDPLPDFLNTTVLSYRVDEDVPGKISKMTQAKCVLITVDKDITGRQKFRPAMALIPRFVSCVGIVKYILGLRSNALTPYGLYKELLKKER